MITNFVNGHTIYLDSRKINSYLVHKCNPGYKLVGSMKRQCGGSKTWNSLTPACVGKETVNNLANFTLEHEMNVYLILYVIYIF